MRLHTLLVFFVIALPAVFSSEAQAQTENKLPAAKPSAAKKPEAPQENQQLTIDGNQLALLIKSTIIAVQHANQTGNYSVLRDLGTPVFREQFDHASLAQIFANLRGRQLNLTPVMQLTPYLTKPAEITAQNRLRIVGNFATQPVQLQYELLFMSIDGIWRLDGLAVDAVPIQAPPQAAVGSINEKAMADAAESWKPKLSK
jgi:hypothetical protein